ncbi:cell surface glycoprotein MUC18 [Spinachia spinachia]
MPHPPPLVVIKSEQTVITHRELGWTPFCFSSTVMKVVLIAAVVALIHIHNAATLLIKGPTQPVLEGQSFTLECLTSDDSELNISRVHFEVFSQYTKRWHPVGQRSWCFYTMQVERTEDSLSLSVLRAGRSSEGPYRCVYDGHNATAADVASPLLEIYVHYMGELSLTRKGYSSYFGAPAELKVRPGDDLVLSCSASSSEEPTYLWNKEGDDWFLPSSTLTLEKITATDEGQYTCTAKHPSVESLSKKRSISITVLSKDARWYESSNGRLLLMTSTAAASLLVFVVSMSVLLWRRAQSAKTCKGPIDDRSQKKPMYRSSVESLPSSTCADHQPLV